MGKIRNLHEKRGLTIEDLKEVEGYSEMTDEQLERLLDSIRKFARITYQLYGQLNVKGTQRIAA